MIALLYAFTLPAVAAPEDFTHGLQAHVIEPGATELEIWPEFTLSKADLAGGSRWGWWTGFTHGADRGLELAFYGEFVQTAAAGSTVGPFTFDSIWLSARFKHGHPNERQPHLIGELQLRRPMDLAARTEFGETLILSGNPGRWSYTGNLQLREFVGSDFALQLNYDAGAVYTVIQRRSFLCVRLGVEAYGHAGLYGTAQPTVNEIGPVLSRRWGGFWMSLGSGFGWTTGSPLVDARARVGFAL